MDSPDRQMVDPRKLAWDVVFDEPEQEIEIATNSVSADNNTGDGGHSPQKNGRRHCAQVAPAPATVARSNVSRGRNVDIIEDARSKTVAGETVPTAVPRRHGSHPMVPPLKSHWRRQPHTDSEGNGPKKSYGIEVGRIRNQISVKFESDIGESVVDGESSQEQPTLPGTVVTEIKDGGEVDKRQTPNLQNVSQRPLELSNASSDSDSTDVPVVVERLPPERRSLIDVLIESHQETPEVVRPTHGKAAFVDLGGEAVRKRTKDSQQWDVESFGEGASDVRIQSQAITDGEQVLSYQSSVKQGGTNSKQSSKSANSSQHPVQAGSHRPEPQKIFTIDSMPNLRIPIHETKHDDKISESSPSSNLQARESVTRGLSRTAAHEVFVRTDELWAKINLDENNRDRIQFRRSSSPEISRPQRSSSDDVRSTQPKRVPSFRQNSLNMQRKSLHNRKFAPLQFGEYKQVNKGDITALKRAGKNGNIREDLPRSSSGSDGRASTMLHVQDGEIEPKHRRESMFVNADDRPRLLPVNFKSGWKPSKVVLDNNFGPNNYGTLEFDNHNTAWYIRVKTDYLPSKVYAQRLIKFVHGTLRYPLPRLMISITGGAQDFHIPKDVQQSLRRGLQNVTNITQAWITSGGSNSGVMKYVGEALSGSNARAGKLATEKAALSQPIIGFATYGIVAARDKMKSGGPISYSKTMKSKGKMNVELQSDHNLFFLVDSGVEDEFGQEVVHRSAFESEIRRVLYSETSHIDTTASPTLTSHREMKFVKTGMPIFSIQIVIEGGTVTLIQAEQSVQDRQPVVVMEGSGRCADVLAYAWRYLHDDSPTAAHLSLAGLRHVIRLMGIGETHQIIETQKSVLHVVSVKEHVSIYRPGKGDELESCFHDALVSSLKLQQLDFKESRQLAEYRLNQKRFYLALLFDEPRAMDKAIFMLQKVSRGNEFLALELVEDLQQALMRSLKTGQTHTVQLLCPHVDMFAFLHGKEQTNLQILFTPNDDDLLPYNNLLIREVQRNPKLVVQPKTRSKVFELCGKPHPISSILPLANSVIGHLMRFKDDKHRTDVSEDSIHGFLGNPGADLVDITIEPVTTENTAVLSFGLSKHYRQQAYAYLDCLVWSLLQNNGDMAEYMWQQGGHSISVALFVGHILKRIAATTVLSRQKKYSASLIQMRMLADRFEDLAIGVLNECYARDSFAALQLLESHLSWARCFSSMWACQSTIELALLGGMKRFLSIPPCLDYLDSLYHGRVLATNPLWKIAVSTFIPPGVLLVEFSSDRNVLLARSKIKLSAKLGFDQLDAGPDAYVPDDGAEMHLNFKKKAVAFFSAPKIKILLDMTMFGFFFLVVVIEAIKPYEDFKELTTYSYIILTWIAMLVLEEARQMATSGFREFLDYYNLLDTMIYFWLLAGFAMRGFGNQGIQEYQVLWYAKYFFGFAVILICIKSLRFYTIFEAVGPKLWMIGQMLRSDIIIWFCMMLVMVVGWGTFLEIVIDSGEHRNRDVYTWLQQVYRIFSRPSFETFDELDSRGLVESAGCLGPDFGQSCFWLPQYALPVMLLLFFIITTVVLTNLLIAMMTRTYETIHEESMEVWHFMNHQLIFEYTLKPPIPSPFSFIWLFFRVKHDKPLEGDEAIDNKMDAALEMFQEACTESFLAKHRKANSTSQDVSNKFNILLRKQQEQAEKLSCRVQDIFNASKQDLDRSTENKKTVKDTMSTASSPVKPMEDYTGYVNRANAAVEGMVAGLSPNILEDSIAVWEARLAAIAESQRSSQSRHRKSDRWMETTTTRRRHEAVDRMLEEWFYEYGGLRPVATEGILPYPASPDRIFRPFWRSNFYAFEVDGDVVLYTYNNKQLDKLHSNQNVITLYENEHSILSGNFDMKSEEEFFKAIGTARLPNGEDVVRLAIPEDLKDWDDPWPEYNPKSYTSPYVHYFGPHSPAIEENPELQWAQSYDVEMEIDAGNVPLDCLVNRIPRNPFGRTGLRGRGQLGKWGPNFAYHFLIHRWKQTENGASMTRSQKPMLEFLVCKNPSGLWMLPGGFQAREGEIDPTLIDSLGLHDVKKDEHLYLLKEALMTTKEKIIPTVRIAHDHRNTDNAWVVPEFRVIDWTAANGNISTLELVDNPASDKMFAWAVAHRSLKCWPTHHAAIYEVVLQRGAFW